MYIMKPLWIYYSSIIQKNSRWQQQKMVERNQKIIIIKQCYLFSRTAFVEPTRRNRSFFLSAFFLRFFEGKFYIMKQRAVCFAVRSLRDFSLCLLNGFFVWKADPNIFCLAFAFPCFHFNYYTLELLCSIN